MFDSTFEPLGIHPNKPAAFFSSDFNRCKNPFRSSLAPSVLVTDFVETIDQSRMLYLSSLITAFLLVLFSYSGITIELADLLVGFII